VLETRATFDFNAKYVIEMGEEAGPPGLDELPVGEKEEFSADVLIASDGPRLDPGRPMVFTGSRGVV
jgi:hypothetical protein